MIFLAPPVECWTDPGPFPYRKLARYLLPKTEPRQPWIEQRHADAQRRQAAADEMERYEQAQADFEKMLLDYQEQGEHMAKMLPLYMHQLTLSHKRQMQDRKSERFYERVDYVVIDTWHFDEGAYYFNINTWDGLPYGLSSADFVNPAVADTLSLNFGSKTSVEINPGDDETRPGMWIIVEHRAGRGLIPKHVTFQKLFSSLPKTAGPLAWPVGQAANGKVLYGNLAELYHLGIGGQTGGGKSNQINCMLGSFLSRNTPADLRLFLVDFKRVEMALYRGLPHLGGDVPWVNKPLIIDDADEDEEPILLHTVAADYVPKDGQKLNDPMGQQPVTDGRVLLKLLDYILSEIFRRLSLMENRQIKKLDVWNKRNPKNKMSQWILVVDELGDIMLQKGISDKVERRLVRVLQLGRAVGVRCILATQTPKSQVITSLIQNNLTAWVVTRTGNGPASGLMLDGKHDAAKLPPLPGRIIFRHAGELTQVQTPEMTDLTIKNIVAQAKLGDVAALGESHQKISPEEFFGYALRELSGYCSRDELYKRFKKDGVSKKDVETILQDYTVAGSPGSFEPEIEINGELYYLTPYIKGQNTPRQLIRDVKFASEFDKWAEAMATSSKETVARRPPPTKNADKMTVQSQKIELTPQAELAY